MIDLFHATRDDVIRLCLAERDARQDLEARLRQQEAEIAQVRQAVTVLTEQLGVLVAENAALRGEEPPTPPATCQRMPGHKDRPAPTEPRRARRQRDRGAGRSRMTPTAQVVHALPRWPEGVRNGRGK